MLRYHAALFTLAIACAAPPAAASDILARYVVMGAGGVASARVITAAAACPRLRVNGRPQAMQVRAKAETLAQRPTLSKPALSRPSAFPVTVCEAALPRRVKSATIGGLALPVPRARVNRIVVIGDTGCRLKASDNAYQACNDPAAYPFAMVAARAAAFKPDLIIHVGDYEYRENPCPDGMAGCQGSPWGYGWDAWNADFFAPGAPLLAAAPLVLVRGNHENCARAGQGWFRMLDPAPLTRGRDCNDPAHDGAGDFSAPYAVPLGDGDQVAVMDLAIAPNKPLAAGDPRLAQFRSAYAALKALAEGARTTFMATHKPALGFAAAEHGGTVELLPGNAAIQSAFLSENPKMFPRGVDVLLSGHVHLWQQVSFANDYPSQFIAGFSGTQEDIVPMPATLPAGVSPAKGAAVDAFSSWIDGFGYMTLERAGARRWSVKVWNLKGGIVNRCTITGRKSRCTRAQVR